MSLLCFYLSALFPHSPNIQTLCVLSGFGGRSRSEMSKGHDFSWFELAATTLVGIRAGDRVARVRAWCKPWILLWRDGSCCLGGGMAGARGAWTTAWSKLQLVLRHAGSHTLVGLWQRGCSWRLVQAGVGCSGAIPQVSQSTRNFSIFCLCTDIESKQVCECAFQEQSLSFLQPSGKPHWFSKPGNGAYLPGAWPQGWGAHCGAETSLFLESIPEPVLFSSSGLPTEGVGPNSITSPLLLDSVWFFLWL